MPDAQASLSALLLCFETANRSKEMARFRKTLYLDRGFFFPLEKYVMFKKM